MYIHTGVTHIHTCVGENTWTRVQKIFFKFFYFQKKFTNFFERVCQQIVASVELAGDGISRYRSMIWHELIFRVLPYWSACVINLFNSNPFSTLRRFVFGLHLVHWYEFEFCRRGDLRIARLWKCVDWVFREIRESPLQVCMSYNPTQVYTIFNGWVGWDIFSCTKWVRTCLLLD